jgi:hypothetical protein
MGSQEPPLTLFPTLGARFGVGSEANVSMSDGGLVSGGASSGAR